MNAQTKATITRDLDTLKSHLTRIEKIEADIDKCHADATEFDQRRLKLEGASYRNASASVELAGVLRQIEGCKEHLEKQEARLVEAKRELAVNLEQLCKPAKSLLKEILERRLETISKIVRPFCSSDDRATQIAQQTCAYQDGSRFLMILTTSLQNNPVPKARRLAAVYTEALKDNGDLMKFLSPAVDQSAGGRNSN
jgi:chromosome segregation ATPase